MRGIPTLACSPIAALSGAGCDELISTPNSEMCAECDCSSRAEQEGPASWRSTRVAFEYPRHWTRTTVVAAAAARVITRLNARGNARGNDQRLPKLANATPDGTVGTSALRHDCDVPG